MANPDRTILVIDGSPESADIYTHLLQQDAEVSYRVLTKGHDRSIVTLCQSESVDCILLVSDFIENNIFEILDYLQAGMGDRCPPIIIIGSGDAELAVQALKAGATDYLLKKKLTSEKLCQAICRALTHAVHLIQKSPEPLLDEGFSSSTEIECDRHKPQVNWRDSQLLLESMLDQMLVGITVLTSVRDQYGKIIDFEYQIVTTQAAELIQSSNLVGKRITAVFPHDQSSELLTEYINVVETGKQWENVQHYFYDGDEHWIQIIASKLKDGCVIKFLDITENKIAEQMLNGSAVAISLLKSQRNEQGKIIDFIYQGGNQIAENLFNQPSQAMRGKTLLQLWPGVKNVFFAKSVKAVETGEPIRIETYYPYQGFDYWFDISVVKNNDGFIMTFQDITTQKKAEQAVIQVKDQLAEQPTDKYRTLFNSMDEGYFLAEVIFDENDVPIDILYLEANPAATRIVGRDFTGRRLREIDPKYEAYWYEIPARVVQTGISERGEKYAQPDQKWYQFYIFKVGELHESKVAVLFNDISTRKHAEEQLRQSEQRYRAIVNQAVTGVCYSGLDGFLTIANQKYCDITGYSAAELSRMRMHEITHPDDLPRNIELYNRMLTEGIPFEIEKRYIRKDGSIAWVNNHVSVIRDQEGNPQSIVAICVDITERQTALRERQQAEEALRESEENFRVIFNASSVGKAQIDAINRRFLRVNPALCAMTGYSESELLTMTIDDLNHPEDCERDPELYQQLSRQETANDQAEKRYICKDGSIIWVNVTGNIIHDANGNPVRTVVVIQDITDRKRREANLAFLTEIADDFSRLSTASEIMQVIGAKIGAYLEISTCNFTDVDEAKGEVTVYYGWNSTNTPSTVGTFRLREYLSEEFERASRSGETVIIRDTQTDPRTDGPGYAALNMYSFVTVPFHQNGKWTHYIAVCDSRPRNWRNDEIELIEELSNRIFPRLERARAEAALRQSEERFRLMADAVPQIVWITDAKGRVELFNKQWSNYTGVPYEPTTAAEVVANFLHSDDRDRTIQAFNEARRRESIFSVEHRIRSATGIYRWFLVRAEPYRDPQTGKIVRWFGASVDIHERKRIEANLGFLAEIMADFAHLETADEIMQMTCRKTVAYFNGSRCMLVKINDAMDEAEVIYDLSAGDLPSLVGTYPLTDFHTEEEVRELAAGRAIVIHDVAALPRPVERADRFTRLQIGALVNASYVSHGQWQFVLSLAQAEPRVWCSDEIELLQEVSARVWLRIERAHAEVALRQSEQKYRSLFNSIDEGFCIIQMIFDSDQKPIDYRFIEINPIFEQQAGVKNALGRTIRELVPNIEVSWVDIYGEVALTGEPTRFVNHAESMGRWFDVNAFRIGEPDERKVAILFHDITARKKSEQERERFLAVGSDFQVITGMNGYFHWVSPSFERLLGWTQAEMTSRPWTDFVHPDDINPSVSETDSLFSGNKTFAFENRYRHKEGSYRWLLWNAQPYPDEQVIYGAAVDITERKRAEVALRESEEQFRTMADHAPFMVWVTDSSGDCIYLSESWYQFTGQTPESSLGLGWLNQTHPDDHKNVQSTFLKANEQQVAFRLEYRLQRKDGEYIWAIDAANPWFGAEGQFKGYIGSVIDISDRKRAEAAVAADLRDTQLLRDLSVRLTTEANPQVLYDEIVTTAMTLMQADAGSFQFLNNETQELLLLSAKGFSPDFTGSFDRITTRFNTSCAIALATGERTFVDFDVPESQDPDGHRRIHLDGGLLSAQSTPLISRNGELIGMVSTHWRKHHRPTERELRFLDLLARQAADLIEQRQDEAERKQLLKQEQAARAEAERTNRIKDEFLSILSHELRSPLNPILGWSRLLQTQKMDDAKVANALATIERNARLQTQLIDDLLDVARILRGKLTLNQEPVDLLSVIEAAIEVVKTAAEAKSILLVTQLTHIGQIRGDHGRLQQIIWNLLSNAIKFTPTGGRVSICLDPVDSFAQVTITDTGRGISSQFLPYIFESFRQEDTSITRQHGGLGLGLSIVKYLVDAHGGTITANSLGEGQGATFIVKLPLIKNESIPALSDSLPSVEIDLAGVKVLAVDDSEDTRALLEVLLTEYGAEVKVVASGKEVLAELKSFEPDVLVCDIGMPDLDGYHLLQQIRALPTEQGGDVPAIAVTAFATQEDYQRALNYGFQKHIAKPIEPEILVITITELLPEN